jgi:hypothetical protein
LYIIAEKAGKKKTNKLKLFENNLKQEKKKVIIKNSGEDLSISQGSERAPSRK